MSEANRKQVGGDHYKTSGLEHWDIVAMFELDYFQGQITKYVMRWKKKGGVQDLKKAKHFLEKYIELQEAEKEEPQKLEMPDAVMFTHSGEHFGVGRLILPPHEHELAHESRFGPDGRYHDVLVCVVEGCSYSERDPNCEACQS